MKKLLVVMTACLVLTASGAMAGDGAWFDMANCGMCKNLSAEPGLMEAMAWENYTIANGLMTVTTVPEEHAKSYAKAHKNMEATGAKLMAGEQMELCGYCTAFMGVMSTGEAMMENHETIGGTVSLVTSSNPEVVAKIHALAERTQKEMKAMQEHAGHDHHGE